LTGRVADPARAARRGGRAADWLLKRKEALDRRQGRLLLEFQELFFDVEKEGLLLSSHPPGFGAGLLVIVPHEVKNAVDEEEGELFVKEVPLGGRLAQGGLQRDDYIAQEVRIDLRTLAFAHGKGEDVGGPGAIKILLIELRDLQVIDQGKTQFRIRISQDA
jgi:hypothetical protein